MPRLTRAERLRGADGDPRTLILIEPRHAPDRTDALQDLGLTPREAEVAQLVATGGSNRDIAARLGVSDRTVQKHLERSFRKLGVKTRSEAAARAWELAS